MPSRVDIKNNSNILINISILNTYLRDYYENIEELCEDLGYDKDELLDYLKNNNYSYDEKYNKII